MVKDYCEKNYIPFKVISKDTYYPEILKNLEKDVREKAIIIASQMMARENIDTDNAYRIAVALAKKHQEMIRNFKN